ncbi:MAG TPA: hypothetical protein PKA74_13155, partial [Bauldia sp.]|nr:hypothetical protein [Bauldia sp.]
VTPPPPRPAPASRPVAPPRPPIATAAETPAAAEETGWVSDLLRRASRDEEPATPAAEAPRAPETNGAKAPAAAEPPVPARVEPEQPLSGLSVDIARAIDHDAFVELWERHRRGEHNVFTRRLYTLQGQQTFDEIRKKYQRDEPFRGAVDRYITDFEKLIEDVTRTRDKAASNAYLVSDTGKVYTMLAHASGRFD